MKLNQVDAEENILNIFVRAKPAILFGAYICMHVCALAYQFGCVESIIFLWMCGIIFSP